MVLTKDQWFAKLSAQVPSWWFERRLYQVAYLKALAAVLHEIQVGAQEQIDSTFIMRAADQVLDAHGDERGVERLTDELDISYAPRIQRLISQADMLSIKAIVDAILGNAGECQIQEWTSSFWGSGIYANRDFYFTAVRHNTFTIITPPAASAHAPYSFMSREAFVNRENFMGSLGSSEDKYASIMAAVDAAKAFGTLYRIVESRH